MRCTEGAQGALVCVLRVAPYLPTSFEAAVEGLSSEASSGPTGKSCAMPHHSYIYLSIMARKGSSEPPHMLMTQAHAPAHLLWRGQLVAQPLAQSVPTHVQRRTRSAEQDATRYKSGPWAKGSLPFVRPLGPIWGKLAPLSCATEPETFCDSPMTKARFACTESMRTYYVFVHITISYAVM